jgi:hypothetical protein
MENPRSGGFQNTQNIQKTPQGMHQVERIVSVIWIFVENM